MADLPIKKALILFSDIIDSSMYSSILGMEQYAKDLLKFQQLFRRLAEKHFKKSPTFKNAYLRINTGGDEGSIFLIADDDSKLSPGDLIYRAIQFAFELKALLELILEPEREIIPKKMHVGTGIHFGDVATVLKKNEQVGATTVMSEIHHIEGYTINYAKRIESSTRLGKYSQVFLSKAASAHIWAYPIVLEKHKTELKGITKIEDVFEVRSAFFRELQLDYPIAVIDKFLNKYVIDPINLDFINEPWLKSFSVSVLDSAIERHKFKSVKEKYRSRQRDIAWNNYAEDDPILLFLRSLDCEAKKQHTRRLSILREIINRYPSFIYAQKELVRAIADVMEHKCLPSELVYAKDITARRLGRQVPGVRDVGRQLALVRRQRGQARLGLHGDDRMRVFGMRPRARAGLRGRDDDGDPRRVQGALRRRRDEREAAVPELMQRLKRVLYWRKQSVDPDVKRFVVVFDFEAFSIEQGFNENAEPGKVAADLRRLAERIEKKDDPLYKEEN